MDLSYFIQEVVTSQGIIIYYYIKSDDYTICVTEDCITGLVTINSGYYEYSHNVNGHIIQQSHRDDLAVFNYMYQEVRKKYSSLINEKTNTILTKRSNEVTQQKVDRLKETINIAPYKRKLAVNSKRSNYDADFANKFNIILEDDEVFVNSFSRIQNYGKAFEKSEEKHRHNRAGVIVL